MHDWCTPKLCVFTLRKFPDYFAIDYVLACLEISCTTKCKLSVQFIYLLLLYNIKYTCVQY